MLPAEPLPPRSYLFVPATRTDRIDKALNSGAHAVIVDLEDAVAPSDKEAARDALRRWLRHSPERPIWLRVNGCETPWFEADLALAAFPAIAGLVIAKAERAQDLPAAANKPLLALIESAQGFHHLDAVAAHPQVQRLLFGTYDLRADLGLGDAPGALAYFASRLVLASRVAGLPAPVDGVVADLEDEAGWPAETRRARAMGFGGKLCIHPRQVAAVNQGFSPTAAEIAWATRIVQGLAGRSAGVVDGAFVDRPILLRAQAIIAALPGSAMTPFGTEHGVHLEAPHPEASPQDAPGRGS